MKIEVADYEARAALLETAQAVGRMATVLKGFSDSSKQIDNKIVGLCDEISSCLATIGGVVVDLSQRVTILEDEIEKHTSRLRYLP
jgi:hypothetical protein